MEPNNKPLYSVAHQPHDALFKKGMTDIEVAQNLLQKKEEIMTAGQYLWNEGMEHGVEDSKLAIAKTMLQDNLPREKISKWTGLDLGRIDTLRTALQ